ncbi:MAG: HMA2 domain-containing protein [Bacillus sp. (in: firmicutes)]
MAVLKNLITQKRTKAILKAYGIELTHSIPGRIRFRLQDWEGRQANVKQLIHDLEADADIISAHFTPETGSLLIIYRHSSAMLEQTQRRWLETLKKYS